MLLCALSAVDKEMSASLVENEEQPTAIDA